MVRAFISSLRARPYTLNQPRQDTCCFLVVLYLINYQLPITNYELPITNYQLPITTTQKNDRK